VATSISSMTRLEERILELEKLQERQMAELKMTAMGISESFSPSNMIRTALKDVVQSPDIRSAAINTAIGIGAGILGRKLVVGNSGNMFKKITGTAVQFLVTNLVRKKIPEMQKKTSGM